MDEDPMEALEEEVERRMDYKKANCELRKAVVDLMSEVAFKDEEINRLKRELEKQKPKTNTIEKGE